MCLCRGAKRSRFVVNTCALKHVSHQGAMSGSESQHQQAQANVLWQPYQKVFGTTRTCNSHYSLDFLGLRFFAKINVPIHWLSLHEAKPPCQGSPSCCACFDHQFPLCQLGLVATQSSAHLMLLWLSHGCECTAQASSSAALSDSVRHECA